MSARRFLTSLGLALAAISCRDANAPTAVQQVPGIPSAAAQERTGVETAHILRQHPNAPPLETYQVSFWASKSRATTVRVKYKDIAGGTVQGGNPFMEFTIPKGGLKSGANGRKLTTSDSLEITMSIDLTTLQVDFEPSGVQFSSLSPATLQMWFGNADPDLNGDGVVDGTDDALRGQIRVWHIDNNTPWTPQASELNLTSSWVWTSVYSFSGYSVAW
jgi:hypothetical protein